MTINIENAALTLLAIGIGLVAVALISVGYDVLPPICAWVVAYLRRVDVRLTFACVGVALMVIAWLLLPNPYDPRR